MKVPRRDCRRVTGERYADDAFPELYQGMSEFALTFGAFSAIDLLHYILEFAGPAYVDCASWCGSYGTMRSVQDFILDGRMLGFRMVMEGGYKSTRSDFCKFVNKTLGDVIVLMPNHAKFCTIYNDKWAFVVETSANLTKSSRTEHYRVTEDLDFCTWVVGYFDKLFELRDRSPGGSIKRADLEDSVYR